MAIPGERVYHVYDIFFVNFLVITCIRTLHPKPFF